MGADRRRLPRIGLTGGIACGKSFVADIFADLGAIIIDTDAIAREVVDPGETGYDAIVAEFGPKFIESDGQLNRPRLRDAVFSDPERRVRLEALLHPLIRERTLELAAKLSGPYQILVIPLLFESGFDSLVDRALVVDCGTRQQRERLARRDGATRQQIEQILAAQLSREARLAHADDVIDNSGTRRSTRLQIERLHQKYLALR